MEGKYKKKSECLTLANTMISGMGFPDPVVAAVDNEIMIYDKVAAELRAILKGGENNGSK